MSSMSLEDRLRTRQAAMTPAVIRVAQSLIDHPERALSGTAAEIAASAKTSDATVIRAVKALGYSGLPELRREIGEQLVAQYDPRESLDQNVARVSSDPRSALDTVVGDTVALLTQTQQLMDHDHFLGAVELLATSPRILVVGWGSSGAVADYSALSFARIGCTAAAATESGFRLADSLSSVRDDCAILLLAPLLHVHEIDITLSTANAVGARVILVTELLAERLRTKVNFVLTVASSQTSTASEVAGLAAIVDALILGVAASNPGAAHERWSTINALRSQFSTAGFTATAAVRNRS